MRLEGIAYIRMGIPSTLHGQPKAYNTPMDDSMTILLAIEGIVLFLYSVVALFGIGSSRKRPIALCIGTCPVIFRVDPG